AQLLAASTNRHGVVLFELGQQKREAFLLRLGIAADLGAVKCAVARFLEKRQWIRRQAATGGKGDERRVGRVHGPRHDLVPGAGLAHDQHRPVDPQKLLDRTLDLYHWSAGAKSRQRYAPRNLSGRGLERASHRRQEFLQTDRLFQKIERADL